MSDKTLYVASLCVAASIAFIWKWGRGGSKLPFPPGPKGLPLLGNVFDIPRGVPMWLTFTSMAQKYGGDLLYIRVLTTDMVILNNSEVVSDLSERRSNIYSDRPRAPMLKLMGQYDWNMAIIEYGNFWKSSRRLLHEFLNARAVRKFDDIQRKHAHRLLSHLIESPDRFSGHIEFALAGLTLEMAYGLNITSNEDPFLRAAVEAVDITTRAMVPGTFLVDIIPMLKYVPEWFPGARFKTFARVARGKFSLAIDGPLDYVKELIKSDGDSNPSIAWTSLNRAHESASKGFSEDVIRSGTATLYMAAVETTVSVLHTFFLTMALHPHIMKKAQEELDRVLEGERLPDFSDEENLPYISAVTKELYRWGCPFPIGVPKRLMEDDTYNGHFIPAGAIIVENIWAMFHDESIYPQPQTFDPERFLKDGKLDPLARDPEERIFGAGRRVCPGRYFAIRAVFFNIACILTLFDITAPADQKLEANFDEEHILRKPAPFKCTIKPRSDASLKLMKFVYQAADQ